MIGGVVAVVVFAMLCLLIILGRYFARHKGKQVPGSWGLVPHRPHPSGDLTRLSWTGSLGYVAAWPL